MLLMIVKLQEESVVDGRLLARSRLATSLCSSLQATAPTRLGRLHCNLRGGQGGSPTA